MYIFFVLGWNADTRVFDPLGSREKSTGCRHSRAILRLFGFAINAYVALLYSAQRNTLDPK